MTAVPLFGGPSRVVKQLLETDPDNRRIYRFHLAEIAWDVGDEESFFKEAESGFHPDESIGGPSNFKLDPQAPYTVLTLMIETHLRNKNLQQAWDLCEQGQQSGFIKSTGQQNAPQLQMVYRKTEFLANQAGMLAKAR